MHVLTNTTTSVTASGSALCITGTALCGPVSVDEDYDDRDFFSVTLPSTGLSVTASLEWSDGTLDGDRFMYEGNVASFDPENPIIIPDDGIAVQETATGALVGVDAFFLVGCKATVGSTLDYTLVLTW